MSITPPAVLSFNHLRLGFQHHCWSTLAVASEIRLYLRAIQHVWRISRYDRSTIESLQLFRQVNSVFSIQFLARLKAFAQRYSCYRLVILSNQIRQDGDQNRPNPSVASDAQLEALSFLVVAVDVFFGSPISDMFDHLLACSKHRDVGIGY